MDGPIEPPDDRFCDLVMKGGITSGIVYPKAIAMLAREYRFKSIGGTSAGAIAAALTAAAEFNRRHSGTRQGFDILSQLPEELQKKVAGSSKLLSLFQAQAKTQRLFSVLLRSLNSGGTGRRIGSIGTGLVLAYWPAALFSGVAGVALFLAGFGKLAAILALLFTLAGSIGAWVYVDITRRVVENGFGLCTGLTVDKENPALTPWLHELIQRTAGLAPGAAPLTFGMLWQAPGFPPPWLKLPKDTPTRSIDLQMFSTNLGHGRPYIFPLAAAPAGPSRFRERERLVFSRNDLAPYLPADVLEWMVAHGTSYKVENGRQGLDPGKAEAIKLGLLEIPEPEDFPVILAARMSLSFPFLFAAVPLWAIDYDASPERGRRFRQCWFSDGGISSNFPMHLFDGLVPLWPTFGINLEPKIEGREMVFLPTDYTQGYGERWDHFNDNATQASRFGGFVAAILGAMQNWNDNSLARMPGVRDRIARVRLETQEGGLNLDMNARHMSNIAKRGEDAARQLLARYAQRLGDGAEAAGWDEQRFVRLGVLLKMIEARVPGLANALDPGCAHASDIDKLIDRAMLAPEQGGYRPAPAGYEEPLTPEQARALHQVLQALRICVATLGSSDFKPIPKAELRVRPPL